MPVEALEVLMLDAIGIELAKIGQAPTSDWLTTTPPAIKEGVPGDKVPAPNLCTLYLQWVDSRPGSDNVGTAQHQLVGTFVVWCCSSHAADGQRRVLRLKEDVENVLRAAEPSFYAQFKYGLDIGPATFTGDDARIRAGLSIAPLEVRITADRTEPVPNSLIQHPFEFPFPVGADRIITEAPSIESNFSNGQRKVVFSRPVGTNGIIRNLSWIVAAVNGLGATLTPSCRIDIHYDGNASPDISIPLLTLGALEYPDSCIPDHKISTPAFELNAALFRAAYPGIRFGVAGNFRLPIPFTNGIEIAVVAAANADLHTTFFNIAYQNRLPNCWNRRLRLYADRTLTTLPAGSAMPITFKFTDPTHIEKVGGGASVFPANIAGRVIIDGSLSFHDMLILQRIDDTHCLVSSKDTKNTPLNVNSEGGNAVHCGVHTFLNRPAGESGYLAMIVGAQRNLVGDGGFLLEANPRLFLDQNTGEPDLEWTSLEDFANGAYYFEQNNVGEEGGIASLLTDVESSFYKVFYKWPIPYSNGVRGIVPQYSSAASSDYIWTTFYYKRI